MKRKKPVEEPMAPAPGIRIGGASGVRGAEGEPEEAGPAGPAGPESASWAVSGHEPAVAARGACPATAFSDADVGGPPVPGPVADVRPVGPLGAPPLGCPDPPV